MGNAMKGFVALAAVVAVLAVGGMAATTLQERAEAEARAAVASEREEELAADRQAEERLLASSGGAPSLGQLRYEAGVAEVEEREAYEREWLSEHAGAMRKGEEAAVHEADYIRAAVAEARAEHERAVSLVRGFEAHEKMLAAKERE